MEDEVSISNTWTGPYTPHQKNSERMIKITEIHTLCMMRQKNVPVHLC